MEKGHPRAKTENHPQREAGKSIGARHIVNGFPLARLLALADSHNTALFSLLVPVAPRSPTTCPIALSCCRGSLGRELLRKTPLQLSGHGGLPFVGKGPQAGCCLLVLHMTIAETAARVRLTFVLAAAPPHCYTAAHGNAC
jgi:hypothetical protein